MQFFEFFKKIGKNFTKKTLAQKMAHFTEKNRKKPMTELQKHIIFNINYTHISF